MSNVKANEEQRRTTPLPRLQLLVIYLIQIAEPITALVIYPFIAQLVRDTGITNGDETKTGYYAGVIVGHKKPTHSFNSVFWLQESIFFLAQCLTVVLWGYLSDRVGRRPVLLLGPLGLSVSMLLFGLSKSFWILVVLRFFQGIFNGNIGPSIHQLI
jgi:MFS family permease